DLKEDQPTTARIQRGDLVIDPARFEVTLEGKQVSFTLTEFKILSILAANPGRVYTRGLLLDRIQGGDVYVDDRNIDVHIRAIRRKLGEQAEMVVTVRGVGYKFRD